MRHFRKRTSQVKELWKIYFSANLTGLGASWSTFVLAQSEVLLALGQWTSVSVEPCTLPSSYFICAMCRHCSTITD